MHDSKKVVLLPHLSFQEFFALKKMRLKGTLFFDEFNPNRGSHYHRVFPIIIVQKPAHPSKLKQENYFI